MQVPRIGIGTIAWTADTPEDEARLGEVASSALSNGLTFFDTAERYGAKGSDLIPASLAAMGLPVDSSYLGGDTESRLGQKWVGDKGVVATKFAPTPWRNDAQSVIDACKGSCERLGVESVDLLQIHMPDIIQPFKAFGVTSANEEAHWDGLAECYHSGIAKNVGVSNYGPSLLKRAHAHLAKRGVPLASNQINLSLLFRKQGSLATLERCRELGVRVLAYFPLANGLLAGRYTPEALPPFPKSLTMKKYVAGDAEHPDGVTPLLAALQRVAARRGKTVPQVAINWCVALGAIPIPGARNLKMARENAGAMGWRLTAEEVAELEAASDAVGFEFSSGGFKLE